MNEGTPQLRIVDELWRQLSAIDAVRDVRIRRAARRRRTLRTLAIAVALLLLLAAAALAARALLIGAPATRSFALDAPITPTPGAQATLLSVRVMDPEGGPPWALRTFAPQSPPNSVCVQAGRVVENQLVGLGINGAFGNDERAHPLPLESDSCIGTNGPNPQAAVLPDITDSSAALAEPRCRDPRSRAEQDGRIALYSDRLAQAQQSGDAAELARARQALDRVRDEVGMPRPLCNPAALRTIVVGFAGRGGGTVTLTEANGMRHSIVTNPADAGAYLFVLAGQLDVRAFTISVRYPNGTMCEQANPVAASDTPVVSEPQQKLACQLASALK